MPDSLHNSLIMSNAPGVIRTHNLLIRSQMLYPVELRVRNRMGRVLPGTRKSRAGKKEFENQLVEAKMQDGRDIEHACSRISLLLELLGLLELLDAALQYGKERMSRSSSLPVCTYFDV
jgi:hypothetical protein